MIVAVARTFAWLPGAKWLMTGGVWSAIAGRATCSVLLDSLPSTTALAESTTARATSVPGRASQKTWTWAVAPATRSTVTIAVPTWLVPTSTRTAKSRDVVPGPAFRTITVRVTSSLSVGAGGLQSMASTTRSAEATVGRFSIRALLPSMLS